MNSLNSYLKVTNHQLTVLGKGKKKVHVSFEIDGCCLNCENGCKSNGKKTSEYMLEIA